MDAANLAVGWSMRVLHTVRFMDVDDDERELPDGLPLGQTKDMDL